MKNSGNAEWKEEKERHASWLELFHDLVFVAVVSQLSENLSHDISWPGILALLHFSFLYGLHGLVLLFLLHDLALTTWRIEY